MKTLEEYLADKVKFGDLKIDDLLYEFLNHNDLVDEINKLSDFLGALYGNKEHLYFNETKKFLETLCNNINGKLGLSVSLEHITICIITDEFLEQTIISFGVKYAETEEEKTKRIKHEIEIFKKKYPAYVENQKKSVIKQNNIRLDLLKKYMD